MEFLNKIPIRYKILSSFFLVAVVLTGVAIYAYSTFTTLENASVDIQAQQTRLTQNERRVILQNFAQEEYVIERAKSSLFFMFAALIIFTLAVALFTNAVIATPLEKLLNQLQIIVAGDLSARVEANSTDEVGRLSDIFNDMTTKIQHSSGFLEQTVQEKTAELAQKVRETERMNKFMLGRELKMIEMKKQIEDLQKKLADGKQSSTTP